MIPLGFIKSARWSPSGRTLAVAWGTSVALWIDQLGGKPDFTIAEHQGAVNDVAFDSRGSQILTPSGDATIGVWGLADGSPTLLKQLPGDNLAVDGAAFSPNDSAVLAGLSDGSVRRFDLNAPDIATTMLAIKHSGEITCVQRWFSQVVSSGRDGRLIRQSAGEGVDTLNIEVSQAWLRSFALHGTTAAVVDKDGVLSLWNLKTGDPIARIHAHDGGSDAVDIHPDGNLIATGGRDGLLRLWGFRKDPEPTLIPLRTFDAHRKPVLTVAFHPQGGLLVSGSGDHSLRIWAIE
jgi:WD40 repeat protein